MAIGVYLRVSTEEQRERQSIATQRDFAERYCALHDLTVSGMYADDGVSGTIPLDGRPEGSRLLRDAHLHKFNQILVYKLDRLGRDTRLTLNAVAELERLGVRVRSMTEEFDTGSATGRLMLTLLAGFASHERDTFRERSMAGVNRLVEAGVWLGGIVPFGYRKMGHRGEGKLVIADEPIPNLNISEADVVREIFSMAAVERKSCRQIAERLNALHVPPVYTRADRLVTRGKRKERTAGTWRPGRIRNMIVNKTYMGIHDFGKRAAGPRSIISRAVPAIVTPEIWKKAQENLQQHFLFNARSAKRQYLLRGMIKCGMCGLSYIGMPATTADKDGSYYRCNGAQSPQIYRPNGRCQSKSIRGDELEQQIWTDVQAFLRDPKPVLAQLQTRMESEARGLGHVRSQLTRLEDLLADTAAERTRMLGLYRRGRVTDADFDAQMDEIGKEEAALQIQLAEIRAKVVGADAIGGTIRSAEELLEKLRKRLDQPLTFEQKRRLIEILVASIRVDTIENGGVKGAEITVTYRFSQPDQATPVILPQFYSTGRVMRIPAEPHTPGDHIRRKRLELKLFQKDVANQFGVCEQTITNWEANTSQPDYRHMPAVIRFLGYNPLPEGKTWGERLVRCRTTLGCSQKDTAQKIGVDQGTLARWERGDRQPEGGFLARVKQFLTAAAKPGSAVA